MKKFILAAALSFACMGAQAGTFQTLDFDGFKVHIYASGDVLNDASFIIEGQDALVTAEQPLFKKDAAEFVDKVKELGKPVAAVISDYHLGAKDSGPSAVPEGMDSFMKTGVYAQMMEGFKKNWGKDMVELDPLTNARQLPFDQDLEIAGVKLRLIHGPKNDFPGADILVGGKVLLTHWAPGCGHISPLEAGSFKAVGQALDNLNEQAKTGAVYFAGGHGGLAQPGAFEFKRAYLENLLSLEKTHFNAAALQRVLEERYPGMQGAAEIAKALAK